MIMKKFLEPILLWLIQEEHLSVNGDRNVHLSLVICLCQNCYANSHDFVVASYKFVTHLQKFSLQLDTKRQKHVSPVIENKTVQIPIYWVVQKFKVPGFYSLSDET